MVKTVAISNCGIGLGHAVRDKVIYDKLKRKFDVKILSYGEGYNFLKQNKIKVIKVPGISYTRRNYYLDIFSEILLKLIGFRKIKKGYSKFRQVLNKINPDVVITDSEPNAFLYAYRRNKPTMVITNVITTLNDYEFLSGYVKNKSTVLQKFMLRKFIEFMLKRGTIFIEPSFNFKNKKVDKVHYVNLIVRKLPSQVKAKKFGKNFFYISVGSVFEKVLVRELLKILPKFRDKFFVIASNTIKKKARKHNYIIFPFQKNPFPYIKACDGIIAPAGHTIISEALVYKKPIFVAPIKNHIEQITNAYLIERQGFGLACYKFEDLQKSLEKFFSQINKFKSNLTKSKFKGNGAEQIAKIVSQLVER